MSIAVVFIGQICSGKSTLSKHYSDSKQWGRISFSRYIAEITQDRNLESNRSNLQKIGKEIFEKTEPKEFLLDVIKYNNPKNNIHIYENIRHKEILYEVKKYYEKTISFYLDVKMENLYNRFINKSGIEITYDKFIEILNNPIEKGIMPLKDYVDYVLDANDECKILIDEIDEILKNHKIMLPEDEK